jgi:hypothetical protein
VREGHRLHKLYADLGQEEWQEFMKYLSLDRLSIMRCCGRLIRGYIADCKKHYAEINER